MNEKDLNDEMEHLMTMCFEENGMVYGIIIDTMQESFIHPKDTPTNSLLEYIDYMEKASPGLKCYPWKLTLEEYQKVNINNHLS